jgi:hypothetical protein
VGKAEKVMYDLVLSNLVLKTKELFAFCFVLFWWNWGIDLVLCLQSRLSTI